MDYHTYNHIRSLLKIIKKNKELYARFEKMADDSADDRIRNSFRLLSLEDWWYLVFRTHGGKGAYLFLKVLKLNLSDLQLWNYIGDCANWTAEGNEEGPYPVPPVTPD